MESGFRAFPIFLHIRLIRVGQCYGIALNDLERAVITWRGYWERICILGGCILGGKPGVQVEASSPVSVFHRATRKGIQLLSSTYLLPAQPTQVSNNDNLLNRHTWQGHPVAYPRNPTHKLWIILVCSIFLKFRSTDLDFKFHTLFKRHWYILAKRLRAPAQRQILERSSVALSYDVILLPQKKNTSTIVLGNRFPIYSMSEASPKIPKCYSLIPGTTLKLLQIH